LIQNKNLSPRQLSLISASIISLVNALLSLFLQPPWYLPLVVFAITFGIVYWLYQWTLHRFIYRKIKLIYKLIYQTKANRREEFFYEKILPQKSIEEVGRDVVEWAQKRRSEVALLQANERYRKEFLMNLGHELRTPVFAIQGYVETLLDGALEDKTVNRKFLSNAAKSVARLVNLLDDLDQISRLEQHAIHLNYEDFFIQDLIRDVFDEFSLRAKEKNMVLQIKKGTLAPVAVHADKAKIRQVLINLVDNAIKYGHTGGHVTAGCYEVDESHAFIEISDNGPGIPDEHLPRVFERFYRADASRTKAAGGTGLGLAIVKHIIEAHGQTVTIRSRVDVGTSIGFMLRLAR